MKLMVMIRKKDLAYNNSKYHPKVRLFEALCALNSIQNLSFIKYLLGSLGGPQVPHLMKA